LRLCTLVVALLVLGLPAQAADDGILLATTTSVRDSGLLDQLLPAFTEKTGIRVRVVAVGTGAALRMGREGNADLLLTHAPAAERELVHHGAVRVRTEFMENHFVVAGPEADPAGVAKADGAVEALKRIVAAAAPYVSRGDDSGTHKREMALYAEASLDPALRWKGYTRTGSGMGLSLQVAGDRQAYILSDIGTFLAFKERTGLVVHSRPEPALRNVYSVLQLDPANFEIKIRTDEAARLAAYFSSAPVQESIATFGIEKFGRPLFRPLLRELP
jgi:tungstate transport system substrate-binding protein